jgi:hypothetical protein
VGVCACVCVCACARARVRACARARVRACARGARVCMHASCSSKLQITCPQIFTHSLIRTLTGSLTRSLTHHPHSRRRPTLRRPRRSSSAGSCLQQVWCSAVQCGVIGLRLRLAVWCGRCTYTNAHTHMNACAHAQIHLACLPSCANRIESNQT